MRDWWLALGRKWLRLMWENPLPCLLLVLIGGTSSFVYSYVPVQGSKDWEIDYLERRVDAQNQQTRALELEVSTLRAEMASRPESGDFDKLVDERDEARKLAKQFEATAKSNEAKVKSSEATIASLRKTRDQWKSQYNSALAERDAEPPPAPEPRVSEAPDAKPSIAPAAPMPATQPASPAAAEWDTPAGSAR